MSRHPGLPVVAIAAAILLSPSGCTPSGTAGPAAPSPAPMGVPGFNLNVGGTNIPIGTLANFGIGWMSAAIDARREKVIGEGVAARIVEGGGGLVQDPDQMQYVNLVGQVLARHSRRKGEITYHFAVLRDQGVNAFAAPGGMIFVTRGALARMDNEAELAAVLAHEIAHVELRHAVLEMESQRRAIYAGRLATEVVGQYAPGEFGMFSGFAGTATEMIMTRGYTPKDEAEADALAVELLSKAGYPPDSLAPFLDRVVVAGDGSFSTHPGTQSRVQAITTRAHQVPFAGDATNQARFLARAR